MGLVAGVGFPEAQMEERVEVTGARIIVMIRIRECETR
jgi:hypothetical protein